MDTMLLSEEVISTAEKTLSQTCEMERLWQLPVATESEEGSQPASTKTYEERAAEKHLLQSFAIIPSSHVCQINKSSSITFSYSHKDDPVQ